MNYVIINFVTDNKVRVMFYDAACKLQQSRVYDFSEINLNLHAYAWVRDGVLPKLGV